MNSNQSPALLILRQALALHQNGRLAEAKQQYLSAIQIDSRSADAYHFLGVLEAQTGANDAALEHIAKAIAINPKNPAFHYNRGIALQALNRFDEALKAYDRALTLKPDLAEVYNNRGNVLQALNRLPAALFSYDKSIAINPNNAQAHNNRGNILLALQRYDEAVASFSKAIALRPDYALAFFGRGDGLRACGKFDEALSNFDAALAIAPNHAASHHGRGDVLYSMGQYEQAIASYDLALRLDPNSASTLINTAHALHALGRYENAVAAFTSALALEPGKPEPYADRALSLQELKRFEEAVASYDQALALAPQNVEAWTNRGAALQSLKRHEEAIESYNKALALAPDNADAHNNLGNAFQELRRFPDALASYETALTFGIGNAKALANRAVVLEALHRTEEAFASYDLAFAFEPELDFLLGSRLFTKMGLCDWSGLADELTALSEGIASQKKVTPPFVTIGALGEPALQKAAAQIWVQAKHPNSPLRSWPSAPEGRKIRVGYFSADLQDHATTHLMAQLFEEHDRERFELYAFSFGPDTEDAMRQRIRSAFDQFIDVRDQSDAEVAHLARQIGLDIGVDLKGFTKDARPGLFVERCAPIQVNYLGYPGTIGANFLDYILADKILIPEDQRSNYSEKVVYLPNCYQPNDAKRRISDRAFTRSELGLPETGFVFCCFNNSFKIHPNTFDAWMRILRAVDGSVLWLLRDNPTVEANLRKEALARGLDEHRLVFADRMPTDEHLARQKLADLFLDTLPCNAHTTASDALWAGLPVLTLLGTTLAGRVGASVLHAIGLPELVTESASAYEAMAIKLGRDPELIRSFKERLQQNRSTSSLFDAKTLARHVEAAYSAMHARRQAGLAPDIIEVEG